VKTNKQKQQPQTMPRKTYSVALKQEVLKFMAEGNLSAYQGSKYLKEKHGLEVPHSVVQKWKNNKGKLLKTAGLKKRVAGGGRKAILGEDLEHLVADEIIRLRLDKFKVTRANVRDLAVQLAAAHDIDLKASPRWISTFMARNHFSLRRRTNLTTLSDEEVVKRAVSFIRFADMMPTV
jgi:hypothetical protein